MPKKFVAIGGETFSSVSKSTTGSEKNASLIRSANPGKAQPLSFGDVLTIPDVGNTGTSFKPYGLDIRIDGVPVTAYDSFTHSTSIDGFRRMQFNIPNEIQTRAITPPLTPLAVECGYNGIQIFGGYLENSQPENDDSKKWLSITCDSWPNLLNSTIPITAFPAVFEKSTLDIIAKSIMDPFSVEMLFYASPGPVFTKVAIEQSDNALDVLSGLAKQRAMVISDDEFGSAVFDSGEISGAPILEIDAEFRPDVSVSSQFSTENHFSHVTGILKSKHKRKSKMITVENMHYQGILKPHTFEVDKSDEGELETIVNSVAARMFGTVFSVEITIPGWTDRNGDIVKCGSSVKLRSPKDYIEEMYEFLIAGVTLNATENQKIATLTCVLPGVYAGGIPRSVPWLQGR